MVLPFPSKGYKDWVQSVAGSPKLHLYARYVQDNERLLAARMSEKSGVGFDAVVSWFHQV